MQKEYSPALRFISALTAFVFCFTSSASALPLNFSSIQLPDHVRLDLPPISIPAEWAAVEDYHGDFHSNKPAFIYIQDAHANFSAQKSIQALLDFLRAEKINLALVEGASSELEADRLRFFPDDRINRAVAEKMAEKGEFTGLELFLLQGNPLFRAYGIENPDLYADNLLAFRRILKAREKTHSFLNTIRAEIDRLSNHLLARELREFIRKREAYRAGRLDLGHFLETLTIAAREKLKIDLTHPRYQLDWPNLNRFVMAGEFKEEISREELASEVKKMASQLETANVRVEIIDAFEELFSDTPSPRHSYTPLPVPRKLLEQIYLEAAESGFRFSDYPLVSKFAKQLILRSEIEPMALHREMEALSEKVSQSMVSSEAEKRVLELLYDAHLLDLAISLELDQGALEEFRSRIKDLEPAVLGRRLANFVGARSPRPPGGATPPLQSMAGRLDGLLPAINEFYTGAEARDEVLVKNAMNRLKETGEKRAVIIAGGFHTSRIKELLAKAGASYMVLTPKINEIEPDRETYYASMLEDSAVEHSHIVKLLASEPITYKAIAERARFDSIHRGGRLIDSVSEVAVEKPLSLRELREFRIRSLSPRGSFTDPALFDDEVTEERNQPARVTLRYGSTTRTITFDGTRTIEEPVATDVVGAGLVPARSDQRAPTRGAPTHDRRIVRSHVPFPRELRAGVSEELRNLRAAGFGAKITLGELASFIPSLKRDFFTKLERLSFEGSRETRRSAVIIRRLSTEAIDGITDEATAELMADVRNGYQDLVTLKSGSMKAIRDLLFQWADSLEDTRDQIMFKAGGSRLSEKTLAEQLSLLRRQMTSGLDAARHRLVDHLKKLSAGMNLRHINDRIMDLSLGVMEWDIEERYVSGSTPVEGIMRDFLGFLRGQFRRVRLEEAEALEIRAAFHDFAQEIEGIRDRFMFIGSVGGREPVEGEPERIWAEKITPQLNQKRDDVVEKLRGLVVESVYGFGATAISLAGDLTEKEKKAQEAAFDLLYGGDGPVGDTLAAIYSIRAQSEFLRPRETILSWIFDGKIPLSSIEDIRGDGALRMGGAEPRYVEIQNREYETQHVNFQQVVREAKAHPLKWDVEGVTIRVDDRIEETFLKLMEWQTGLTTEEGKDEYAHALSVLVHVGEDPAAPGQPLIAIDRRFLDLLYSNYYGDEGEILPNPDIALAAVIDAAKYFWSRRNDDVTSGDLWKDYAARNEQKGMVVHSVMDALTSARVKQLKDDPIRQEKAISLLEELSRDQIELAWVEQPAPKKPAIYAFPPSNARRAAQFRALMVRHLKEGTALGVPGVGTVMQARQAELAGAEVIYLSGASYTSNLGLTDTGVVPPEEVFNFIRQVARRTSKPVLVDLDTAGMNAEQAAEFARRAWMAGAAVVHVEDQRACKLCGHVIEAADATQTKGQSQLVEPEEFAAKIRAMKEAVPELYLFARTDARRSEQSLDRAILRSKIYLQAGANGIFPEALGEGEFGTFATELRRQFSARPFPLLANMTEFGETPYLTVDEFAKLGYQVVIWPVTVSRAANFIVDRMLEALLKTGTQAPFLVWLQTRDELYRILGYRRKTAKARPVEELALAARLVDLGVIGTPRRLVQYLGKLDAFHAGIETEFAGRIPEPKGAGFGAAGAEAERIARSIKIETENFDHLVDSPEGAARIEWQVKRALRFWVYKLLLLKTDFKVDDFIQKKSQDTLKVLAQVDSDANILQQLQQIFSDLSKVRSGVKIIYDEETADSEPVKIWLPNSASSPSPKRLVISVPIAWVFTYSFGLDPTSGRLAEDFDLLFTEWLYSGIRPRNYVPVREARAFYRRFIAPLRFVDEPKWPELKAEDDKERARLRHIHQHLDVNTSVSALELSVRSRKALRALGITTLKELTEKTEGELLAVKNFGQSSLREIKIQLARSSGLWLKDPTPIASLDIHDAIKTMLIEQFRIETISDLLRISQQELEARYQHGIGPVKYKRFREALPEGFPFPETREDVRPELRTGFGAALPNLPSTYNGMADLVQFDALGDRGIKFDFSSGSAERYFTLDKINERYGSYSTPIGFRMAVDDRTRHAFFFAPQAKVEAIYADSSRGMKQEKVVIVLNDDYDWTIERGMAPQKKPGAFENINTLADVFSWVSENNAWAVSFKQPNDSELSVSHRTDTTRRLVRFVKRSAFLKEVGMLAGPRLGGDDIPVGFGANTLEGALGRAYRLLAGFEELVDKEYYPNDTGEIGVFGALDRLIDVYVRDVSTPLGKRLVYLLGKARELGNVLDDKSKDLEIRRDEASKEIADLISLFGELDGLVLTGLRSTSVSEGDVDRVREKRERRGFKFGVDTVEFANGVEAIKTRLGAVGQILKYGYTEGEVTEAIFSAISETRNKRDGRLFYRELLGGRRELIVHRLSYDASPERVRDSRERFKRPVGESTLAAIQMPISDIPWPDRAEVQAKILERLTEKRIWIPEDEFAQAIDDHKGLGDTLKWVLEHGQIWTDQGFGVQAIATNAMKRNLSDLKNRLPEANQTIQEFGEFLATRVGHREISPAGFIAFTQGAVADLENGIDSITGSLIHGSLVGLSADTYTMLWKSVPKIAEAVAPPQFAKEVERIFGEIDKPAGFGVKGEEIKTRALAAVDQFESAIEDSAQESYVRNTVGTIRALINDAQAGIPAAIAAAERVIRMIPSAAGVNFSKHNTVTIKTATEALLTALNGLENADIDKLQQPTVGGKGGAGFGAEAKLGDLAEFMPELREHLFLLLEGLKFEGSLEAHRSAEEVSDLIDAMEINGAERRNAVFTLNPAMSYLSKVLDEGSKKAIQTLLTELEHSIGDIRDRILFEAGGGRLSDERIGIERIREEMAYSALSEIGIDRIEGFAQWQAGLSPQRRGEIHGQRMFRAGGSGRIPDQTELSRIWSDRITPALRGVRDEVVQKLKDLVVRSLAAGFGVASQNEEPSSKRSVEGGAAEDIIDLTGREVYEVPGKDTMPTGGRSIKAISKAVDVFSSTSPQEVLLRQERRYQRYLKRLPSQPPFSLGRLGGVDIHPKIKKNNMDKDSTIRISKEASLNQIDANPAPKDTAAMFINVVLTLSRLYGSNILLDLAMGYGSERYATLRLAYRLVWFSYFINEYLFKLQLPTRAYTDRRIGFGAATVKVLIYDKLGSPTAEGSIRALTEKFGDRLSVISEPGIDSDESKLLEVIKRERPTVIVISTTAKGPFVKPDVIKFAADNGVRVLFRAGAGVDNVNLDEADNHGITVARSHGNAGPTAEHALRLAFHALGKIGPEPYDDSKESRNEPGSRDVSESSIFKWAFPAPLEEYAAAVAKAALDPNKAPSGFWTSALSKEILRPQSPARISALMKKFHGRRFTILGYGEVGAQVADKLNRLKKQIGYGFDVVAWTEHPEKHREQAEKDDVRLIVDRIDALGSALIVSNHLPGGVPELTQDELNRFIGESRAPQGTFRKAFVNTGRASFSDALTLGMFMGAGDVLHYGDIDVSAMHATLQRDRPSQIVLTPHIAFLTQSAAKGVEANLVSGIDDVTEVLLGQKPATERTQVMNKIPVTALAGFGAKIALGELASFIPALKRDLFARLEGLSFEGPRETRRSAVIIRWLSAEQIDGITDEARAEIMAGVRDGHQNLVTLKSGSMKAIRDLLSQWAGGLEDTRDQIMFEAGGSRLSKKTLAEQLSLRRVQMMPELNTARDRLMDRLLKYGSGGKVINDRIMVLPLRVMEWDIEERYVDDSTYVEGIMRESLGFLRGTIWRGRLEEAEERKIRAAFHDFAQEIESVRDRFMFIGSVGGREPAEEELERIWAEKITPRLNQKRDDVLEKLWGLIVESASGFGAGGDAIGAGLDDIIQRLDNIRNIVNELIVLNEARPSGFGAEAQLSRKHRSAFTVSVVGTEWGSDFEDVAEAIYEELRERIGRENVFFPIFLPKPDRLIPMDEDLMGKIIIKISALPRDASPEDVQDVLVFVPPSLRGVVAMYRELTKEFREIFKSDGLPGLLVRILHKGPLFLIIPLVALTQHRKVNDYIKEYRPQIVVPSAPRLRKLSSHDKSPSVAGFGANEKEKDYQHFDTLGFRTFRDKIESTLDGQLKAGQTSSQSGFGAAGSTDRKFVDRFGQVVKVLRSEEYDGYPIEGFVEVNPGRGIRLVERGRRDFLDEMLRNLNELALGIGIKTYFHMESPTPIQHIPIPSDPNVAYWGYVSLDLDLTGNEKLFETLKGLVDESQSAGFGAASKALDLKKVQEYMLKQVDEILGTNLLRFVESRDNGVQFLIRSEYGVVEEIKSFGRTRGFSDYEISLLWRGRFMDHIDKIREAIRKPNPNWKKAKKLVDAIEVDFMHGHEGRGYDHNIIEAKRILDEFRRLVDLLDKSTVKAKTGFGAAEKDVSSESWIVDHSREITQSPITTHDTQEVKVGGFTVDVGPVIDAYPTLKTTGAFASGTQFFVAPDFAGTFAAGPQGFLASSITAGLGDEKFVFDINYKPNVTEFMMKKFGVTQDVADNRFARSVALLPSFISERVPEAARAKISGPQFFIIDAQALQEKLYFMDDVLSSFARGTTFYLYNGSHGEFEALAARHKHLNFIMSNGPFDLDKILDEFGVRAAQWGIAAEEVPGRTTLIFSDENDVLDQSGILAKLLAIKFEGRKYPKYPGLVPGLIKELKPLAGLTKAEQRVAAFYDGGFLHDKGPYWDLDVDVFVRIHEARMAKEATAVAA